MRKKKIICIVIILLLMVTTYTLSANMTSSNQLVEPDGRIFFTALSAGPCGIAWGYGIGNESGHTPDAYIEPGKGFIINFGTMPYHSLNSPFLTNYLVEDNDEVVLWKVSEKTLISINWQHEEVKHHLQVICTPLEQTTATFLTNQTGYLICPPPTYNPGVHESNCMAYTGTYRNESKIESISGFAILLAIGEGNASSTFPEPIIMIWLLENKDGGEIQNLLTAIWAKNGLDVIGMTIEKAKTFHVNFWTV